MGEQARRGIRAGLPAMLAFVLLIGTAEAAPRGIELGFADQRGSVAHDPAVRALTFDTSREVGAGYARIGARWASIERELPADRTDPADPAFHFARLDAAVRDASARGLKVLLTVYAAPSWVEGPGRPRNTRPHPPGTWEPDSGSFGEFAVAIARRYDGTFVRPGSPAPLPRVQLYEAWNEPNLTGFLSRQWLDSGDPRSPGLYRRLLNSFYEGVKSAQPGATVLGGATGPSGGRPGSRRVNPLRFYRKLFCLKRGSLEQSGPCPEPARFDALSHHPISPDRTPRERAIPGDLSFRELPKLRRVLRAAERAGTVHPGGVRRKIWATEFWWESSPPMAQADYEAPSERGHAKNIADAIRVLWKQRIPVAFLLQVRDDPEVGVSPRTGWGSGVLFADGEQKPAYRATRFPLVADRVSRRRVAVWTRAPRRGRLRIVIRRKRGGLRSLASSRVGRGEVVRHRLRLRRAARISARLKGERSFAWRVPRKRITR